MRTLTPINRRDLVFLLFLLALAAILRMGDIDLAEFFHDEAMVSTLAQEIAQGERFRFTGIVSSVGIPNPPTSIYVMVVPFLFTSNPVIATGYVALLNVTGVGLFWFIAHRYFGRTTGIVAALLFTVNPWAVLYSRKIWAQDYVLPFFLLALILGLYGFAESGDKTRRRTLAQLLFLPLMLFTMQIHFAAWTLLPLVIGLMWIGRKHITRIVLATTLILSALVMLSYAIGLANALEQNPMLISDFASRASGEERIEINASAVSTVVTQFASGLGVETWVAPQNPGEVLQSVTAPTLSGIVLAALTVVGVIITVDGVLTLGVWPDLRRKIGRVMLAWLLLPILIFLPGWTIYYPHYLIPALPAFALFAGVGFAALLRLVRKRYVIVIGLWVALVLIIITHILWWRGVLHTVATTPLHYPAYTTPLRYLVPVRDELSRDIDVIIISNGMEWAFDHEAARWPVMLRDTATCIRTLPGDGYAVFPNTPFAVLIAPDAPPNPIDNLYVTDSPVTYPTRPGDNSYTLYRHTTVPDWNRATIIPGITTRFDSGVQLMGYALQNRILYLEWLLPERQPDLDYQYYGHLLDADGERLTQRDVRFWPGRHWCAGDRLITWTPIDTRPEAATLRVGLYTLDAAGQFISANVVDELGNPAGQWVDIPLSSAP